jgi:SAM-dependent methyltransferase
MSRFFGELYLRSTLPFLPEDVTVAEADYLARTYSEAAVPPGPLLDLGCGHGRHLKLLPSRVPRPVVGLDFDALSLTEARGDGLRVRGDFFRLPFRDAAFAGCYCWYNSAFTFEDERQVPLFKEVARCLKPGAVLILQTAPVERIRTLSDSTWEGDLPDGSHLVETCHFDQVKERDEGHRTLRLPDGRTMAASYFIRYYSRSALSALLETAGFRVSFWHAGVEGQAATNESQDLVVGAIRGDS